MGPICFRILGEPASKANSRRLVPLPVKVNGVANGKTRQASIKSKKSLDFEADAVAQIPPWAKQMLAGPVKVTMRIYYASRRPDLDESVILDVLQAKYHRVKDLQGNVLRTELVRRGVYINDRQVDWKDIRKMPPDPKNPRVEIQVESLEPQQEDLLGGGASFVPDKVTS